MPYDTGYDYLPTENKDYAQRATAALHFLNHNGPDIYYHLQWHFGVVAKLNKFTCRVGGFYNGSSKNAYGNLGGNKYGVGAKLSLAYRL